MEVRNDSKSKYEQGSVAADGSAVPDSCTGRGVQSRYLQQGGKY